ncbi:MAG: transcription termination/antitermination factor NusG [Ruminococcaceae bacterium]|nr:transcription termination/antitermination factor NusG [Oscillospiraceae bacterium]MBQ8898431.1 transcription termination/antitermination factor NusG [Clostridia bacterium]
MAADARWYVIHTYSGYENKVATTIEKTVENHGLQDLILEVMIPVEKVTEIKDNRQEEITRKVFPGYVLVKMVMNDESWHIVRNIRGVTSFVGPGSKPVPLTEQEVIKLGVERDEVIVSVAPGDRIRITDGPFEGFMGTVEELSDDKRKVKVKISMFGRDTSVELDTADVEADEE